MSLGGTTTTPIIQARSAAVASRGFLARAAYRNRAPGCGGQRSCSESDISSGGHVAAGSRAASDYIRRSEKGRAAIMRPWTRAHDALRGPLRLDARPGPCRWATHRSSRTSQRSRSTGHRRFSSAYAPQRQDHAASAAARTGDEVRPSSDRDLAVDSSAGRAAGRGEKQERIGQRQRGVARAAPGGEPGSRCHEVPSPGGDLGRVWVRRDAPAGAACTGP